MNGVGANGRVNGRVPRYHRIAETLRDRIREGLLAPGARLANQRQLAKSFGVTLMTLRQALELLEREHLITRRHGLGTFVAAPPIDYDILQLRRFAGDLSAKGEHVATRLLGTRFAMADRRVAEALRRPGQARVAAVGAPRRSLGQGRAPRDAPSRDPVRDGRPARRGGAAPARPGARAGRRAAPAGRRPPDEPAALVPAVAHRRRGGGGGPRGEAASPRARVQARRRHLARVRDGLGGAARPPRGARARVPR